MNALATKLRDAQLKRQQAQANNLPYVNESRPKMRRRKAQVSDNAVKPQLKREVTAQRTEKPKRNFAAMFDGVSSERGFNDFA
jgi:hypothetical protein